MSKTTQTKAELLTHLRESLGFLRRSSEAFDAGFTDEAKRLATTIRVLVHDTQKSKSLLGLLHMKSSMGFLNTAYPYNPKNLLSHHGLIGLRMENGRSSYWAPKGDASPGRPHKYVLFPDWWNDVVVVDSRGARFNRRDLVLALANQDGGAHVDPQLDSDYAHLSRHNSAGWMTTDGKTERPIMELELHCIRQIAYELATSIDRQLEKKPAA